jgi:hypothetical protein
MIECVIVYIIQRIVTSLIITFLQVIMISKIYFLVQDPFTNSNKKISKFIPYKMRMN